METQVEKIIKKAMLEKILLSDNIKKELESKKVEIFSIIPELEAEYMFNQKNPWHVYDVWKHTLVALSKSDKDIQVRLALLLHDIGKPYSYQDDGNIRHFKGHAEESAKIALPILQKLGYSPKDAYKIGFLILNHSTPINVENINKQNLELTKKLLHVQYCDAYAYSPKYVEQAVKKLDVIKEKIDAMEKEMKNKEKTEDER